MKYLLLIILFFPSCMTAERCAKRFPPSEQRRTDTIIKEVVRDTTITITLPGESATLTDTIYITETEGVLNSTIDTLNTEFATSLAWVQSGTLRHELTQHETEIERVIKNAIRDNSTHTVETVDRVHNVYRDRWYHVASFYIVLALIVLIGIRKILF